MKTQLHIVLAIVPIGVAIFVLITNPDTNNTSNTDLNLCRQQVKRVEQKCATPISYIPLRPAQILDRTTAWESFSVTDGHSLSFRHPVEQKVTVQSGVGDVVLNRVRVGSLMIFEAVSNEVAGDNPADYERLVYNSIAQNTQPNWTNYAPGYSSEKFGSVTLHRFHTNIFDVAASLDLSVSTTFEGVPLAGIIFDPVHKVDWLIYFQERDAAIANDLLRSIKI